MEDENEIPCVDVIVVGAGFAGLSAARYLSSRSIPCLVIEGRCRLGGRTLSRTVSDGKDKSCTIDLGGQWIGPKQKRVLSLIEQFQLDLIEQTWHQTHPSHLGQSIGLKGLSDDQLTKIALINKQWDQMAHEVVGADLTLISTACEQWAEMSLAQFLQEHPLLVDDRRVEEELQLQILTLTASNANQISLLYWLIFIRSIPDGLKSLDDGLNGAQHYKIALGSQHLCSLLARDQNISFDDPLKSVNYGRSTETIRLELDSGRRIDCRRLLLAFSPALLSSIEFTPSLACDRPLVMAMGQCIKSIFIYSKAFWRSNAVGECQRRGPCSNIFESTQPNALIGLVLGDDAAHWSERDESQLIAAITEQYSTVYGTDEKPVGTYVQYWPKEKFSRGCYAALYPPCPFSHWLDRRKSLLDQRIWLASSEMALQWIGYIEGAIEAGNRFAQDIARSL